MEFKKSRVVAEGLHQHIFSHYPLEQAAFEQFYDCALRIRDALKAQPETTLTTPICGHGMWLAGEALMSSHDVGFDADFSSAQADEGIGLNCIDGIGVGELTEMTASAEAWLSDPSFIALPEGTYMGSPCDKFHGYAGNDTERDTRIGCTGTPPYRGHVPDPVYIVIREGSEYVPIILSVDGKPPRELGIEVPDLDALSKALLAGSSLVSDVTMWVPNLPRYGRPTCFDRLPTEDLLTHLCYGSGFSPDTGGIAKAPTLSDSRELGNGLADTFQLDFTFRVSASVVREITRKIQGR